MSDLSRLRQNIQVEETRYGAGVSEFTLQKVGGAINFINDRQYDTLRIPLNGSYWATLSLPQLGVEAIDAFPFDIEIFDILMYNITAGSSGTTELDIKFTTASGGTFNSIFTTTPKIASSAGNFSYFLKSLGAGSGQTAPVFNATYTNAAGNIALSAGSAIRVDLIAIQGGTPENCGIQIFFRPV